jgi:chaperonin GroEL (HSP60 family)
MEKKIVPGAGAFEIAAHADLVEFSKQVATCLMCFSFIFPC